MEDKAPPHGARFAAWLSLVEQACDVSSAVLEKPPARFNGTVHKQAIGRLTLVSVTGTAYAGTHARTGGTDLVGVLLAVRGITHLTQGAANTTIAAGHFCMFDTTVSSTTIIPAPFHNVLVRLPRADLEAILPGWQFAIGKLVSATGGARAMFFDCIRALVRHGDQFEPPAASSIGAAVTSLLAGALLTLPQARQPSVSQIEQYHRSRIKAFVQSHLRNPDLDVDMVAGQLGLSARHIHRLFRGESQHLMHWVWSERLRLCYDDLCRAHLRHRTVAQIAYGWGFNDPAHFSRAFRQRFGVSPSEVREQARPK